MTGAVLAAVAGTATVTAVEDTGLSAERAPGLSRRRSRAHSGSPASAASSQPGPAGAV